ncbi:hypothetical protein SAMN05216312_10116 [Cohnella sp. OV330]|uniref:hypothetical protein n=1 Tax=Cohnella sp. OV330 TaxID=1855288 RepID=UPI0008EBF76D|nr:hypothetical protein [Cohnella sp. OV330]SFA70378.1 hypothetical protein SAMN05216312_10116 [Cohnella sp. OV330]
MHKLLFSFLMIVVWWLLHAMQLEEETALGTLHEGKRAVDRAAHAAAQQLDELKLETGTVSIDSARAEATARAYLAANLRLAADLSPLEGEWMETAPEIVEFAVINEHYAFPYTYRNAAYNYEVTLRRPGVVMIVHIACPRVFGIIDPIEWDLKGAAELVFV